MLEGLEGLEEDFESDMLHESCLGLANDDVDYVDLGHLCSKLNYLRFN